MFESFFKPEEGHLAVPTPDERFHGRHSVALLGVFDSGEGPTVALRNSWGPEWGDNHIGYFGRDWFEYCVDEAHIRRSLVTGPSIHSWDRWQEQTTPEGRAREWMRPNPFSRPRGLGLRRHTHRRASTETISFWWACIAEVMKSATSAESGWRGCIFFHGQRRERRARALVPPWNRGRGYGTELEELARSQAEYRGCGVVRFTLDEADALPRNCDVAVGFLERRGYTWTWEQLTRPNLAGVAERRVKDDV